MFAFSQERADILPDTQSTIEQTNLISILNFIDQDTVIFYSDFDHTITALGNIYEDALEGKRPTLKPERFFDDAILHKTILLHRSNRLGEPSSTISFNISPQPLFHKDFDMVADTLKNLQADGYTIYICSDSVKQTDRIAAIFHDRGDNISFTPITRTLHEGFTDNDARIACFTDHQIFDRFHKYNLKSDKARHGKMALTMKELQEHAHLIFGDAMTLDYFVTDTVEFRFSRESSKKVPVELYGGFEMDPEYMALSEVRMIPDSVTVFGDESLLASVRSVSTSRIFRSGIHKDMSGTLKLRKIKGLRVSDEQVRYELKVVRFVEVSREVPVRVFSRPDGKDCIVIPSTVNVVCKCPFPYQQDPFDGAVFGIEYSDYVSSRSGMCRVSGRNLPDAVISYTIEPEIVECVVGEQ